MNKRAFKDEVYGEISRIAKALSHANRLEIVDYIANGPKCVEDIALQTGISIANASQHLQTLKKERLVLARKKGVQVYYALASDEVYRVWRSLRDLALAVSPQIAQTVKDVRRQYAYGPPVTLEEIMRREDVCLLDVRPKEEFEKRHIPRAISVPIGELRDRLEEIPKDKLVIAYCRGMFCSLADEAVDILQREGFKARKIEESVLDYPV